MTTSKICTASGNGPTPDPTMESYFCTFLCDPKGAATECGPNATCFLDGNNPTACLPNSCLGRDIGPTADRRY